MVDYLNSRFSNESNTGIAYIYCNFQRQNEQNIDHLLASVLKQLTKSRPSMLGGVRDLYDEHWVQQTRPSLDEIVRVLHSVAATYSRLFVVVDALDECQASDGRRTRFLNELSTLQEKQGANIFATSRFITEISDHFKPNKSLEIRAKIDDVRGYLRGHMGRLPQCVQADLQLQEEIRTGFRKPSMECMFSTDI